MNNQLYTTMLLKRSRLIQMSPPDSEVKASHGRDEDVEANSGRDASS